MDVVGKKALFTKPRPGGPACCQSGKAAGMHGEKKKSRRKISDETTSVPAALIQALNTESVEATVLDS